MQPLSSLGVLAAAALLALAPAAAAEDKGFPKGTFTQKGPDGATWAITFDGKDKYTVTRDGAEGVKGTYKAAKDQVEFTDESGPFADKGEAGTYKWKLEGKKLIFTKVKDDAKGRAAALTSGPWEQKE